MKLFNVKVFCVGVGGLGSFVVIYVVVVGIGIFGIVDVDMVDLLNL